MRDKASIGLVNRLIHDMRIGSRSNAADAARELLKLELAIKMGIDYFQD